MIRSIHASNRQTARARVLTADDASALVGLTLRPNQIGINIIQLDAGIVWVVTSTDPVVLARCGPTPEFTAVHSFFIENPLTGDDGPGFFTKEQITISELRGIIVPGAAAAPSVTWSIHFGPDRDAAGTEVVTGGTVSTNITTGDAVTVFNAGVIPAESFVWIELVAVTIGVDAPDSFAVTLNGKNP